MFGDPTTPQLDYLNPSLKGTDTVDSGQPPAAGYPFTLAKATLEGTRLRFSVLRQETWAPWCSEQTPHVIGKSDPPQYGCSTDEGYMFGPGGCFTVDSKTRLDCARLFLCTQGSCTCAAGGCVLGDDTARRFRHLHQRRSYGRQRVGLSSTLNVHLAKVASSARDD